MVPLMLAQENRQRSEPVKLILVHDGLTGQNGLNAVKNAAEEPQQSQESVFMDNKVGILRNEHNSDC